MILRQLRWGGEKLKKQLLRGWEGKQIDGQSYLVEENKIEEAFTKVERPLWKSQAFSLDHLKMTL